MCTGTSKRITMNKIKTEQIILLEVILHSLQI